MTLETETAIENEKTFTTTASQSNNTKTGELTKWALDATHSHVGFSVRHMMVSNVRGEFKTVTGSLLLSKDNIEKSSVSVTIETASIETRDEKRDAHLKSPDFFETEKYPQITFESTSFTKKNDEEIHVKGNLTIHGVTKPVTLVAEPSPEMKAPWGGIVTGFSARTKINRKDFNLGWNAVLEAGGVVVGEDVTITIDAEFVKQ